MTDLGLIVSLIKTNIMDLDASNVPCIKIGDFTLTLFNDFI